MPITPDQIIYWRMGALALNATIVFTWVVMALLSTGCWLIARRLTDSEAMSRWQNLVEVVVTGLEEQIRELSQQEPRRFLPFVGTLFIFIAVCNILSVVPGFQPPTGSLNTTVALSICVLVAVPAYGVAECGLREYLGKYLKPTPLMLPFNAIGELSRTVALAVRLFGNVMSATVIGAILISIVPFLFPVLMQLLGLLTGVIQAYIFAVLAMVYIAAATRGQRGAGERGE